MRILGDELKREKLVVWNEIATGSVFEFADCLVHFLSSLGVISLSKPLDRETRDSYTLTVVASDLGSPPMRSSVQVAIKVLDVNDNRPQFNETSLKGGIPENSPIGALVMRVMATDADIGTNAQLVFNLTTNAYSDVFSLNPFTGEIKAQKTLDREKQDRYSLKISVSDQGYPQLTSSGDVTINVIDVDDNCPEFVPAEYNVTVRENVEFNQSIVQVTATDADLKNNEIMLYAIRSGNTGGAFTIDRQGMLALFLLAIKPWDVFVLGRFSFDRTDRPDWAFGRTN